MAKLSIIRAEIVRQEFLQRGIDADLEVILGIEIPKILDDFRELKAFSQSISLSQTRKNFTKALRVAERLAVALSQLDDGSPGILEITSGLGCAREMREGLAKTISRLRAGLRELSFHRSGNGVDEARLVLARNVAFLLHSIGVRPTSSRDGLYLALLLPILEQALGRKVREVHELGRRGLAAFKEVMSA